ncbi:MAG: hypothetical protein ABEJ40_01405 [Haloarculaceae archaeon]
MTTTETGDLEDATSVLVLALAVRSAVVDAYANLIDCDEFDRVIAATVSRPPADWEHQDDCPMRVSRIDVNGHTRSAADAGPEGAALPPDAEVSDPTDLEKLGRAMSDALERANEEGDRAALVVHSVSDLLHHSDEATVFKFVYTLGEVVRRADGKVYFHFDSRAHEADTLDMFETACDAVAELDGGVTVTKP